MAYCESSAVRGIHLELLRLFDYWKFIPYIAHKKMSFRVKDCFLYNKSFDCLLCFSFVGRSYWTNKIPWS